MDTLTHALAGALIVRATAPRNPGPDTVPLGRRVLVGFLAAAAPDLDFVLGYLSPLSYLYNHRGVTHSVLLLPLWTVLLSVVFAAIWRFRPGWRPYAGIVACALASHIALDLITAFGTMIFAPFSDARYALSATFIIDLCFTGIILVGLIACAMWRRSRIPAVAGVAVLAGYVGLQVVLQHRAVQFGEEYARSLGADKAVVTAQPRPVSPFNWTVIVADDERYHYAHVNLIRQEAPNEPDAASGFIRRLDAAYRPLREAQWKRAERYGSRPDEIAAAREAFEQPAFRFFRWFAAYPARLEVESANPGRCIWFHDLRFVTPGRSATPFLYGMCREERGVWKPFQRVGDDRKPVY